MIDDTEDESRYMPTPTQRLWVVFLQDTNDGPAGGWQFLGIWSTRELARQFAEDYNASKNEVLHIESRDVNCGSMMALRMD